MLNILDTDSEDKQSVGRGQRMLDAMGKTAVWLRARIESKSHTPRLLPHTRVCNWGNTVASFHPSATALFTSHS